MSGAVEIFYEKVLSDPSLSRYFDTVDIAHLKGHQRAFIAAALGGPQSYSGRARAAAHAGLDIDTAAFDAVVGHLVDTLTELGVAWDVIEQIGAKLVPLESEIVTVHPALK